MASWMAFRTSGSAGPVEGLDLVPGNPFKPFENCLSPAGGFGGCGIFGICGILNDAGFFRRDGLMMISFLFSRSNISAPVMSVHTTSRTTFAEFSGASNAAMSAAHRRILAQRPSWRRLWRRMSGGG